MSKRSHAKGRQYAALPFADVGGETKFMLVTSRGTGRWVLPKGWAEPKLTGSELAAKEAFEEAGIVGRVADQPVGFYTYDKRLPEQRVVACKVDIYPLHVEQLLEDWPERTQRQRQWFTPAQAALRVDEGELVTLLLGLVAVDM